MMYFPGSASGATAGRSGTGGATLDQLQRRAQQVSLKGATPSQNRPPASDPRMRAALAQTFAGSSLNTTLEAGAARPHTGGGGERGDPASPAHRDAAGSRGGNRGGASPYGALVPRQHAGNRKAVGGSGYGTPLHASQGRGAPMQRPSQQYSQQQQRIGGGRMPANVPRARYPQNFPVHQEVRNGSGYGSRPAGGFHPGQGGYGNYQQPQEVSSQWNPPCNMSVYPSTTSSAGLLTDDSAVMALQPHQQPQPPQQQSRIGGGLGSMAANARDTELSAAMAELNDLQGLANGDARDSWRFEQAARPTTAPAVRPLTSAAAVPNGGGGGAGSVGGGAQVLNASALGDQPDVMAGIRPSTAAMGEETEEELRLRLATAESVMRKLYRKTNDLQERLTASEQSGRPSTSGGGEAGPSSPSPTGGNGGSPDKKTDLKDEVTAAEREQALFLLQQKEGDLQRMREYTSQLASRLEHLAAEQQRTNQVRPGTSAGAMGGARNDEYRDRYMRVRNDYRNLLRSRTDSVKRSGRMAADKEQGVLIEQLDAALKDEADLHRKESQRLNEELYLQEKKSCDWYVEKRLLQDRLQALESEIGQRDQIEGQIDDKMLALFNRLKMLEDANLRLEQSNEMLRAKAGDTSGEGGGASEQ